MNKVRDSIWEEGKEPYKNKKNKIAICLHKQSVFSFKSSMKIKVIGKLFVQSDSRRYIGLVAQWLEHTLDKRGVESSTLSRPTISSKLN